MGEATKIQWCDATFNPWRGCEHATLPDGSSHPGCDHCYAEAMSKRNPSALGTWGGSGTRVRAADAMWRQPLKWNREAEQAGERRRVFCASLADVFEDWSGPILDSKGQQLFCCCQCGERWAGKPYDPYDYKQKTQYCKRESVGCRGYGDDIVMTMADLRRDLFALIDQCPWLDFLLLTKRPQNVRRMWPAKSDMQPVFPGMPGPLGEPMPCVVQGAYRENCQLITSISNQPTADAMIPELLKLRDLVPVLGLSAEPLLGPIDLGLSSATCDCCDRWPSRWVNLPREVRGDWPIGHHTVAAPGVYRAASNRHGALSVETAGGLLGIKPAEFTAMGPLDWVIIGGESGPNARPCDIAWIRSLVDQCRAAGVAAFVKQLGSLVEAYEAIDPLDQFPAGTNFRQGRGDSARILLKDSKGGDPAEWPEDLRVREFPEAVHA